MSAPASRCLVTNRSWFNTLLLNCLLNSLSNELRLTFEFSDEWRRKSDWISSWSSFLLRLPRSSLHGSLYRLPVSMENVCCHGNVLTEPLASSELVRCCGNVCLASSGLPLCYLLRERVSGKPLASSGLPLWPRSFGFQASYHIMYACNDPVL
jgi:hypothetical protein